LTRADTPAANVQGMCPWSLTWNVPTVATRLAGTTYWRPATVIEDVDTAVSGAYLAVRLRCAATDVGGSRPGRLAECVVGGWQTEG